MDEKKVKAFLEKEINWEKYIPLKTCKRNLERALFILVVAKEEAGIEGLSAPELALILNKKLKLRPKTSPQAIRYVLDGNIGENVDVTIREKGVRVYHVRNSYRKRIVYDTDEINANFGEKDDVLPLSLFSGTKGYIQKAVLEVNECYRAKCFTACQVMLRRVFETLIIEVYEAKGLEKDIKDAKGDYLGLEKLIEHSIQNSKIKLSKTTKKHLPKIKMFGDNAAHNRKYTGKKTDIVKYSDELRICAEELIHELL